MPRNCCIYFFSVAETQTVISSIKALKNSSGNCSVCLKVGTGKEFRSLVSLNLVYRAGDRVRGYSTRSVGPGLRRLHTHIYLNWFPFLTSLVLKLSLCFGGVFPMKNFENCDVLLGELGLRRIFQWFHSDPLDGCDGFDLVSLQTVADMCLKSVSDF